MTSPLSLSSNPVSPASDPSTPAPHLFSPSAADLARIESPSTRPIPGPASARKALSSDAQTQARRKLFLSKVRQGGDDKRWEQRSRDLERLDRAEWEREVRAWERERLLDAPGEVDVEDEEVPEGQEVEEWMEGEGQRQEDEVEDVAMREQRELEELVGMMQVDGEPRGRGEEEEGAKRWSEHFGSDDEEFEAAFEELLSDPQLVAGDSAKGDEMDLGE
ncbi:Hypothetical protein D9617_12g037500 [Elsinoe fawcettii]|nr:Hypothetical protein D9617_12g037500 [Elsinoe fawcettii]